MANPFFLFFNLLVFRNSPIFTSPTPRRRIINTIVLLLLVATVIPYQFAYIVGCIVQVATCVRAQWHVRDTVSVVLFPLLA
jgi:GPI inositol-deacylase